METYQGKCRGCGAVQSIMAESQEEADQYVTEDCDCIASERLRASDEMLANIYKVVGNDCVQYDFNPVDKGAFELIKEVAFLMADGKIGTATFAIDGTTIKLKTDVNGNINISRTKVKEIKLGG